MTKESQLRDEFADMWRNDYAAWNGYLAEAQNDLEFALLCQYTEKEWNKAERQGRELLTFDKTKRQLDLLEGYEQRNRHILKIGPIEKEDDLACQQHTGLIMHTMAGGRGYTGYDCLSSAFKWGSLATASNLIEIWKDRNGNIRLFRRPFNSFLLDPMLTQPDLSDCGHIITGQWVRKDKVKLILPTGADKIDKIPQIKHSLRWPYMSAPLNVGDNDSDIDLYEEKWTREIDYEETILFKGSGKTVPFKDFKKASGFDNKQATDWLKDQKLEEVPMFVKYSRPIEWINLVVYVNGEPVWEGENPLGIDDYNFVWLHGEWVPECGRSELKLQPFVRCLRDPQRAYNRKTNQAFDIIESQIQTGKILRDKFLKNPKDAYKSGQGIIFHLTDKASENVNLPLREVIQNVDSVDIKPGLFQLMEQLDKNITTAGGLNEEIFGTDDKNEMPGILHKYRTGAALTGKQGIYSGFRSSKRELGIKLVKVHQKNYDPFKVQRIIGEYPVRTFYQPDFDKYDCTPTEGLLTDTQRQLSYLELKQMRQEFPDAAQLIPLSMLFRLAPIQATKELMQVIEKGEKQQMQLAKMQMQNQQRVNALVEAQAQADLARAKEDISDIQVNRSSIALKNAQTMTELNKLRGEDARQPSNEMFDKMLSVIDRLLEFEKIKETKKQKRKKGA